MNLMNKSIITVMCLTFVLSIIGGFVYWICIMESKPSPEAYATDDLYSIRSAIGRILGSSNETIEDLLSHPSQEATKTVLANFLRKRDFASVADRLMGSDGWGRPYYVDWRTNLANRSTAMLEGNDNSLLIWSAGSNDINEFGGGDDLFDSCDWRVYKQIYKQRMEEANGAPHSNE